LPIFAAALELRRGVAARCGTRNEGVGVMLALQNLIGKRGFKVLAVITVVAIAAVELTGVFRNYLDTYIQKQAATYAEQKAKAEADVATATAREKEAQAQLAAEVAANAKFRQLAEAQLADASAREKEAQAQLAAEVAANAKLRQAAEAQLAEASAREKEAMAITAAAIARNSPERQRAVSNKPVWSRMVRIRWRSSTPKVSHVSRWRIHQQRQG